MPLPLTSINAVHGDSEAAENSVIRQLGRDLWQAVKRTPGNLVGGPVDASNLVMGIVSGKKLDGLVDEPIGGSNWFNKKFGLGSTGKETPVQQATEFLTGLANPGTAVKTAIFLPAMIAGKTAGTVKQAAAALDKGVHPDHVYKHTGVFRMPGDDILRAEISDKNAKLKTGPKAVERSFDSMGAAAAGGPAVRYGLPVFTSYRLEDLLDHPELYARVPDLKDVKVTHKFGGWKEAAYHPDMDAIAMGASNSEKDYLSMLLHEVQHAVQERYGMGKGGNTSMFFRDKDKTEKAYYTLVAMQNKAVQRLKKRADVMGENMYKASPELEKTLEWKQVDQLEELTYTFNNLLGTASNKYLQLPGEEEARLVQRRFENPQKYESNMQSPERQTEFGAHMIKPYDPNAPKLDDDSLIQTIVNLISRQNTAAGK